MNQMETRRMCPHCRAFITTKDRVCPYCNERVGERVVDQRNPSPILGGLISHANFTTMILLLINVGLYVATVLASMRAGNNDAVMNIDGYTLIAFGAKLRELILLMGQRWRWVTAGFLHGGVIHIAMNMWVLYDVGAQVEQIYGTSRMLVIYFVATVLGFIASTYWSNSLSVGASAGLMGLIGAMIAVGIHHQSPLGAAIRSHYIRWMLMILAIGFIGALRVDNAAHIGGLVGGFGIAYVAGFPRVQGTVVEQLWRAAAAVCVILTAISFFDMYRWLTTGGQ
jgi:rhomboid protease GluP